MNSDSTHTCSCIQAVPTGVFQCLAKLTSKTRTTMKSKMDELYPDHCEALLNTGLLPDQVPMMRDVLKEIEEINKSKHTRKSPDQRKSNRFSVLA